MCECETNSRVYDKKRAELELFLVRNKVLPNELSIHHGHIMVNIETVDFDNDEEYHMGVISLKKIYDRLSTRPEYYKFHNRLKYHDDVDEIEIIG